MVDRLAACALLALIAAATACSFRVGYDHGAACGRAGRHHTTDAAITGDGATPIPDGATLIPDGATPGGDGATGVDGGLPAGPRCSALQGLRDDFADGAGDLRWNRPTQGGAIVETGGHVEL